MNLLQRAGSHAGYRGLLEKFYTIYEPLEEKLAEAVDWRSLGWDFEERRKVGWLKDDLQALGVSAGEVLVLPSCDDLPELDSIGAVVGCLYVLEGSTLGGQFISKLLRQRLGITQETGGRFFTGYADQTGARWREFGAWAEGLAAANDSQMERDAVDAAKTTFDCFSRWFQC